MAFFENVEAVSFPIGAAIGANLFVTIDSSGEVVAAAADASAIGVTLEAVTAAQYDSGAGQVTVPVAVNQGAKVKVIATASAAIAVGGDVACGATGFAIAASTGASVMGVALEVAGSDADQEVITMLFSKTAHIQLA